MLVGHFAAAMVAKRIEPRVSLGTTVLASMFPDLLWAIFLLAGIEHVAVVPGVATNRMIGLDLVYSHGLLPDIVWAAMFAAIYFGVRKNARGAWVLFAAVLSHWVLDVISHRPDMPLAPGGRTILGLGLWNSLAATILVEGGFWLLAIVLYVRVTTSKNRAGIYGFWIVIALLTWIWFVNITTPPPPNGVGSLVFFTLVIAWAYWMNRCFLGQPIARRPRAGRHRLKSPGP